MERGEGVMNRKEDSLVSIIVPIYNTQEFLPRCLDSILNQSYANMQIVLVNDGSTDDSLSVCEEYAAKDNRIQVINQSNQGIIAAKRAGIKLCRGEYVMFVDSDDWIESALLRSMVQAVQKFDCMLVCTNVYKDFKDRTVEMRNYIPIGTYETGTIAKDLFYYKDTQDYGILPYSVAKLYPRDILEEILNRVNSDIRYAEDKAIVFSLVFQDIKVCFTDDIYYHYCVRNGSVCYSENQDYLIELTTAYKYIKKLFDKHKEREYLLWQLGKWMWIEAKGAINNQLGLTTLGNPLYREPYRLDPSTLLPQKKRFILYGAGKVGTDYRKQIVDCMNIELCGWVDKNYEKCRENGLDVQPVEYLQNIAYDYILVAVNNEKVFCEIKKELKGFGVVEDKIIWGKPLRALQYC